MQTLINETDLSDIEDNEEPDYKDGWLLDKNYISGSSASSDVYDSDINVETRVTAAFKVPIIQNEKNFLVDLGITSSDEKLHSIKQKNTLSNIEAAGNLA